MRKCLTFTIIGHGLIWLLFLAQAFSLDEKIDHRALSTRVGGLIKMIIRSSGNHIDYYTPGGEHLYSPSMLARFYERRNFQPAWSGDEGLFTHAEFLLEAIEEVNSQGLVPEFYHLESIKTMIEQVYGEHMIPPLYNSEALAELDLLLTDVFLMLGCRFSAGCVNPLTLEIEWFANRVDLDVDLLLEDALKENSIQETLHELLPSQKGYSELRQNLIYYREIAANGGWPRIPDNVVLKKGVENNHVFALKKRLAASGDLEHYKKEEKDIFNDDLRHIVKRFQRRHGLNPDGIVGLLTRKALNIPASTRVRQIEVNLERLRWSARKLGHRYIIVNIADFRLDVIEHGRTLMSMAVVVGKPYWYTPILSEKMTHIILNPSWNIPSSISKEEILPKIKSNSDYLEKQDIKILTSWAHAAEEIAPETINWSDMNEDNLIFKFRQEPGPLNPLGRIKFLFPNRFEVYMHDTPARELFSRNVRALSHGCIRISRPIDLAEYLLKGIPDWTHEKIQATIKAGKEHWMRIPQPIDVHMLYLTAWVDEEGILQFRDDVYGRDERLDRALQKGLPTSPPEEKIYKTVQRQL